MSTTTLPKLDYKTLRQSHSSQKHQNANKLSSVNFKKCLNNRQSSHQNIHHSQNYMNISSHKNQKNQHIFTSAESLKDQYIYKNMQLDLGSLASFIYDQSDQPLLNYKQKIKNKKPVEDFDDDRNPYLQQNLDNRTPLEVLKFEDNEKKRAQAAKDFVQQIFKKHFGQEVEKFEEKNAQDLYQLQHQNQKEIQQQLDSPILKVMKKHKKEKLDKKIELLDKALLDHRKQIEEKKIQQQNQQELIQQHSSRNQQENLLKKPQQNQKQPEHHRSIMINNNNNNSQNKGLLSSVMKQKNEYISQNSPEKSELQSMQRIDNHNNEIKPFQNPSTQPMSAKEREDFLFSITIRHTDIHSLYKEYRNGKVLSDSLKNYIEQKQSLKDKYIQKVKKYDSYVIRRRQNFSNTDVDFNEFRNEFLEKNEMPTSQILIWEKQQIIAWNENMYGPNLVIYMVLNFSHFQHLKRLELVNTEIKDGGLFVLMELVSTECKVLEKLDLSINKIGIRTAQSLQKNLPGIPLKSLKMKHTEMTTKLFCIIALGIAKSATLEDINFAENLLDNRSVKTLETLIRYIKNLIRVDISLNNHISDDQKKNLKKLVVTSAQLKHKDVRYQ